MSPDMWGRPALIEGGGGGLDGRDTKEKDVEATADEHG
jgi:hypothetical protein